MYTVLVIDDSWVFRKMIARSLATTGYQVLCAADSVEAWEILEKQSPDLILLDIELPGLSGIEFLEILRELPAWADLPVLVLSGGSEKTDVLAAARLGASGYLLKKKCRGLELQERITRMMKNRPIQLTA